MALSAATTKWKYRALGLARSTTFSAVLALGFKAGGSILALLAFMLMARKMSVYSFGEIAIWFNAMSILAVIAAFGQDTLIVRSWGEYYSRGRTEFAHGAYQFGWRVLIVSISIWSILIVVVGYFGGFGRGLTMLVTSAAFMAAQATLHYYSHACRTILGFRISETNRELTWRAVLLAFVILTAGDNITVTTFLAACFAGLTLSNLFQFISMRRGMPDRVKQATPLMKIREWIVRARAMWISASAEAASQYLEVVLLGLIASPAVAGGYFAAARIASIFPMIGTGLHTYTVSHASNLFFSGQLDKLQQVLRTVMLAALAISLPFFIVLVVFGKPILAIFGEHFQSEYFTLVVLSLAGFITTLAGPASGLLLVTGDEKFYSRAVIIAIVLRMTLLALLAPRYGAMGAAISWALVNCPLALVLSLRCRAQCGIDPSVLRLAKQALRSRQKSATP